MSLGYFARYRFNGSDVAEEDFGKRDLAVEAGTLSTHDDGVYGSCLYLDGTTSLLSTGNFTKISDDAERCFSWWSRSDSPDNPVLCYGELSSPNAFVLYSKNASNSPEFYDYDTRRTLTTPVTDSVWNFFMMSYENGSLNAFVNGTSVFSEAIALTTGTSDPLRIGTDGRGEYFEGFILDLRIWDTHVDEATATYMYSTGPNFEEELSTNYAQDFARSQTVAGHLLCRSMYGVKDTGGQLTQSFFALDEDSEPTEAARVEHSQEVSGMASETVRVRQGESLQKTIEISPEATTFISNDDETKSVVFSSEGVHIVAGGESGCMFFGAGRDFRMRATAGTFLVEAFSSVSNSYKTKMEVGS